MMKYCLKKQMALVLSAVLLAISLVVPTAAEGTATPVNLVTDGGFEGQSVGTLSKVTPDNVNQWGILNSGVAKVVEIVSGPDAHTGEKYAKVAPQIYNEAQGPYLRSLGMVLNVEANTEYLLTFWAKSSFTKANVYGGVVNANASSIEQKYDNKQYVRAQITGNTWKFYSVAFNSNANTAIGLMFGANLTNMTSNEEKEHCIDDVAVYKSEGLKTVKVEATGDNTAAASSALGLPGTVLTATAAGTDRFLGWYKNGTLVSTSAVYTLETALEEDSTFLAKFSGNIIKNGGFEAFAAGDLNTRYDAGGTLQNFAWGRVATNVTCGTVVASSEDTHAGSNYLSFHPTADANQFIRTVGTVVPVEQNKQYRLTFWAKSLSAKNETNISAAILKTTAKNISDKIEGTFSVSILKENTAWQEYTLIFNSSSYTQVVVAFGGNTAKVAANYAIDDIALYDLTACGIVTTGADSSTGKLNEAGLSAAIRAASNTDGNIQKNGLRVYNTIEKDLLCDVVEYGTIVVRKDYLQKANNFGWKGTNLAGQTFAEPTVEMYGIGGIGFGVAYRKAGAATATGSSAVEPILWRDDLNGVAMYTAFATGIAEDYYGDAYLYRSYAVLTNDAVVYGRTVEVSVFDVANAISNAETAPEVDTAAFYAFVNENTGAAYESWCTKNGKETGRLYN